MDRGRTFLAAGLVLFLGCMVNGAEGTLLSTPARTGQALMLRPVFDAVSRDVFSVRARGAQPARWVGPGRAGERRDALLRRPVDRPGRDVQRNGRASGHVLSGPEMALAGVFVLWGVILIAGRLRRRAARPR